jgi:N-acetylmuramoyl-L-alanine amidase
MILQGQKRYPVCEAILHCAAIKGGQFKGMAAFEVFSEVNRWHKERGFKNGFGYHGLIMPSGEYFSGRPWNMIGAHVIGHNAGTLGFLLIESREITHMGGFFDWFTVAQGETLRGILAAVPGLEKVSGHNDYAPKLCPGFKVESKEWL